VTSIENLRSALVAVKPGAVACRIINMIWKNFGYLSLFNLITIAFPLLTYPYLTQYLGADYFSKSIYIQTIISYFTVFVGFGINISGTKIIAAHRNDKNEIDKIFWQLFVVKLFLASISTILLILVVISFDDCFFYFLSLPLIYAELFFPQWYYQGMERMKNITIINLVSRVMVFLMIIFYVKGPSDVYVYLMIFSFIPFIVNFFSFLYLIFSEKISFKKECCKISELKGVVKYSLPIFCSTFLSVIKDRTNIIIIGALIGAHQVIAYDFLIKVVNVISGVYSSFTNAQFPYFVKNKDEKKYKKYTLYILISSLIMVLSSIIIINIIKSIGALAGVSILNILFFDEFNVIFYWLIWLVPLRALSYQIGMCKLIPEGLENKYTFTLLISTIIYMTGNGIVYLLKIDDLNIILFVLILSVFFEVIYRLLVSKLKS